MKDKTLFLNLFEYRSDRSDSYPNSVCQMELTPGIRYTLGADPLARSVEGDKRFNVNFSKSYMLKDQFGLYVPLTGELSNKGSSFVLIENLVPSKFLRGEKIRENTSFPKSLNDLLKVPLDCIRTRRENKLLSKGYAVELREGETISYRTPESSFIFELG